MEKPYHVKATVGKLKKRIILELKKIDRYLRRLNTTLECNKQARLAYKSTFTVPDLNHPSIKEAKKYWGKYNIRLNPKWHAFYASLNNIHSSRYVPQDIFYNYIMPSLNNNHIANAYNDKNMYDIFMRGVNMPKTVLRCMNGNLYDADYNLLNINNYSQKLPEKETDCFVKPSIYSGGGRNIKKSKIRNGRIFVDESLQDINELIEAYGRDFIIQEAIDQSLILSDIYPFSVNSIRSISIRHEGKIIIISHQLNFGNNQSYISNTSAGGLFWGIDKSGNVTEFGYDKKFNKIFEHPFTKKSLKNLYLPKFGDLENIIRQCHAKLPHFNLVAWDFGLDKFNQYILIEYNLLLPGLDFHQVINGPIFEKYLDVILDNLHEREYI
jgi:hypothetical protein